MVDVLCQVTLVGLNGSTYICIRSDLLVCVCVCVLSGFSLYGECWGEAFCIK